MRGHKKRPVPGLVPGTHVFFCDHSRRPKTWMAGTRPAKGGCGCAVALVER